MRAPKPNDHHHIIYHVHVYILYVRAITGVRVLNEALHPHSEYLIIQLYAGRIKLRLCNIHLLLLPQLTQKKGKRNTSGERTATRATLQPRPNPAHWPAYPLRLSETYKFPTITDYRN